MFSSVRNFCKSVSTPSMCSHLFKQYFKPDVFKINQNYFSSILAQPSPLSWQHTPTVCPADRVTGSRLLLSHRPMTFQSVRTNVRVHFRPSAWKRYNKHNIEKRLSTPGGLAMLWRKVLKGRHKLAVYERILPNTVNGKSLPDIHFKYKAHPLTKRRLPKPGLY